jgi:hypothetical protein
VSHAPGVLSVPASSASFAAIQNLNQTLGPCAVHPDEAIAIDLGSIVPLPVVNRPSIGILFRLISFGDHLRFIVKSGLNRACLLMDKLVCHRHELFSGFMRFPILCLARHIPIRSLGIWFYSIGPRGRLLRRIDLNNVNRSTPDGGRISIAASGGCAS